MQQLGVGLMLVSLELGQRAILLLTDVVQLVLAAVRIQRRAAALGAFEIRPTARILMVPIDVVADQAVAFVD